MRIHENDINSSMDSKSRPIIGSLATLDQFELYFDEFISANGRDCRI